MGLPRRWLLPPLCAALTPALLACTGADTPRVAASLRPPSPPAEEAPRHPLADGARVSTYLGDGQRRTYGEGPVPDTLDLVWKLRIGSGTTSGKKGLAPVVWSGTGWTGQPTLVQDGGRLFLLIGGYDHGLRKIDASTGETVWKYAFDDVIKGTACVFRNPSPESAEDRYIVVGGSRRGYPLGIDDDRVAPVRALAFGSGRELWRLPVPRTRCYSRDADSSSVFHDGRLYIAVESGYVYAVDPTRTQQWKGHRTPVVLARSPLLFTEKDLALHGGNVVLESSPAILGDRLYVASGSGHVYGLDLKDLSVEWDFRVGSDIDGTPAVTHDGKLLVAVEEQYVPGRGGVLKLDPAKLPEEAVQWFFPTKPRGFAEWKGGVVGSVSISDATQQAGRPRLAAFCSVDGNLYVVAHEDLAEETVDGPGLERGLRTPKVVFSAPIGGSISTPLIIGDRIVAAGYDRRVHVYTVTWSHTETEGVRAADGSRWHVSVRETATHTTAGTIESTPLVWKGRLFVGSRDGYLYCLGDPSPQWGAEGVGAYLE